MEERIEKEGGGEKKDGKERGKEGKGERERREEKGRIHVLHVSIFISLIHSWKLVCRILSVIITLKCVS